MIKFLDEELNASTTSMLVMVWRRILLHGGYYLKITPLMNDYLAKVNRVAKLSNTKAAVNRTNLVSKITGKSMTWKVLISLLSNILNIEKSTVTITITVDDVDYPATTDVDKDSINRIWDTLALDTLTNVNEAIDDYVSNIEDDDERTNKKSNETRKLKPNGSDMTWKTLIPSVRNILRANKIKIAMRLYADKEFYSEYEEEWILGDSDE